MDPLTVEVADPQELVDAARVVEAAAKKAPMSNVKRGRGESMTDWGKRLKAGDASNERKMAAEKKTRGGGSQDFEKKHPRARGGEWTMKAGASGDDVRAVQQRVGGTKVDGSFGKKTAAAVRAFQKRHGLKVDGIVGRQTLAAMAGRKDAAKVKPGAASAKDREKLTKMRRRQGRAREAADVGELAEVTFKPSELVVEAGRVLEGRGGLHGRQRRDRRGKYADVPGVGDDEPSHPAARTRVPLVPRERRADPAEDLIGTGHKGALPEGAAGWKAVGSADDEVCAYCGKQDLKGTVLVVAVDADGVAMAEARAYGKTCAARATGRKTSALVAEARDADTRQRLAKRDVDEYVKARTKEWVDAGMAAGDEAVRGDVAAGLRGRIYRLENATGYNPKAPTELLLELRAALAAVT